VALLTVETELKGSSKSTNEKGLSLIGSLGTCAGKLDFCSVLAALVGLVQNIFFLNVHFFNFFVPIAQQARQAAVLGRLSLIVCFSGVHSL
jgi:hypothetical protein